ncbi:putative exonuclease [Pseudomonas phage UAntarctica]|nr:putative exonuclease [Pseudomonas phage UAntarctica]
MFNNQSIKVFAHDYETTGVNAAECGVLQCGLGIVTLHQDGSFEVLDKDVQLLNPGVPIDPGASKIHGYYDIDVADKVCWMKYLGEQFETVNSLDCHAVLGFNSGTFDNRIAARAGLQPMRSIDLIRVARRLKGDKVIENAKLVTLYQHLMGKPLEKAHDAWADVHATLELVKPSIAAAGVANLDELMEWMRGDDGTVDMKMPWGEHKGSKLKNLKSDYVHFLLNKCSAPISPELREGLEKCQ